MNLYEALIDVYEKCNSDPDMIPLYHSTAIAQITVKLDCSGNFISAEVLEKEDGKTVIPVTEKSSARTKNAAPHMLYDSLKFLAGDYFEYTDITYTKGYLEQLEDWIKAEKKCPGCRHAAIHAIYDYVNKKQLIRDLVEAKVLILNEKGKLDHKRKIQGRGQEKAFVRFQVGDCECSTDKELQEAYVAYCRYIKVNNGFSYMTGAEDQITYLHPRKIRTDADQGKLLSGNDSSGFTFRGLFRTQEEAYAVGYEDSQKAHNALKWLIRKFGYHFGDLCIVVWEKDMNDLPDWSENCDLKNGVWNGMNCSLDSTTYFLALDSAVPGRLSIQEFSYTETSNYIKHIIDWHKTYQWECYGTEENLKSDVKRAAALLYGNDNGKYLSMTGKEDQYKYFVKRWIKCILYGKPLPKDIIYLAIKRASSPVMFSNYWTWREVVAFANVLVNQDRENMERDRSYLYGRILAVMDHEEAFALYIRNIKRDTNARKYMKVYAQYPFRTYKILEQKIAPYLKYLPSGRRNIYERELQSILNQFSTEMIDNDESLNGKYLIGYHQEMKLLDKKFSQKKEEKENE